MIAVQQRNQYEDRVKALASQLAEAKQNHDQAFAVRVDLDKAYSRAGPRKRRTIAADRTAAEIRERRLADEVKRLQRDYDQAAVQKSIMQRGQLPR